MDRLERAQAWAKFPGTWSEFLEAEEQEHQHERWCRYKERTNEQRREDYQRRKRSGVVQFKRSVYVTAESNAE